MLKYYHELYPILCFFPANQNQKRYVKFMPIKFSLFQSRSENIIHDCLNLLKKEKKISYQIDTLYNEIYGQ